MNPTKIYKRLILVSWALLAVGGLGFFHGLTGYLLAQKAIEGITPQSESSINVIWLVIFAIGVVLNVAVESYLGRRVWMELAGSDGDWDAE